VVGEEEKMGVPPRWHLDPAELEDEDDDDDLDEEDEGVTETG
jgi:hypothetical protein